MTKTFQIAANGIEMGAYAGANADEAISAYIADAGYDSIEDAADVLGQTVEAFLAEITVTEVK